MITNMSPSSIAVVGKGLKKKQKKIKASLFFILALVGITFIWAISNPQMRMIQNIITTTSFGYYYKHGSSTTAYDNSYTSNKTRQEAEAAAAAATTTACDALELHETGHWEHHYFDNSLNNKTSNINTTYSNKIPSSFWNNTSSLLGNMYLPQEIDWLRGKNLPDGKGEKCNAFGRGAMYTSTMGNQCERWCYGHDSFRPSHSVWTLDENDDDGKDSVGSSKNNNNIMQQNQQQEEQQHHQQQNHNPYNTPSMKLIQRLSKRNETLCFAGDSIDSQIHDALSNNLRRIQLLLQNNINNLKNNHGQQQLLARITVDEREIAVDYVKEYGDGAEWIKGWMVMTAIKETSVTVEWRDGSRSTSRFQFFKTYGYPPWNFEFMNECTIVSFNLGLHYNARAPGIPNGYYGQHTLSDDIRGAITFLMDFVAAKENRIAVWRSALPQHFSTFDGHHEKGKDVNCSLNPLKLINSTRGQVIQNYNKAYEEVFSSFCDNGGNLLQNKRLSSSCGRREHDCTVNRTSVDYPTPYKFFSDNNFTRHMERFRGGDDGKDSNLVTGKILRWNIADLFDVGQWHISDCSHYCYVPPLYEAAFERLLLLLDHHSKTL
mmetsp:Transcript_18160/g.39515  ORF Transcript_18160/g.39515 Transcript_18160/m.39515 type:complete len:602 (+) Transcript_18160:168-1973(+)